MILSWHSFLLMHTNISCKTRSTQCASCTLLSVFMYSVVVLLTGLEQYLVSSGIKLQSSSTSLLTGTSSATLNPDLMFVDQLGRPWYPDLMYTSNRVCGFKSPRSACNFTRSACTITKYVYFYKKCMHIRTFATNGVT